MILICYDGSPDARAAVDHGADRPVIVVPSPEVAARRARDLRSEDQAA